MTTISAEAKAFITENLTRAGYQQSGEIEVIRQQIWASIWRVPINEGWLYFKITAPATAYEPTLTETLARQLPEYLPPLLAIDKVHGWLLLGDGGTPLKEIYKEGDNIATLEKVVIRLARLQKQVIEKNAVNDLLEAGCPDRRLDKLPTLYAHLLSQSDALMLEQKGGITQAELQQFQVFKPELAAICEKLADYNIPASLHHDDFNAGNILLKGEEFRFIDWAESYLTHPFCSMFVFLRVVKYIYKCDDSQLAHLREVYLQVWADYNSQIRLLEAFNLAQRLAKLCRALTWYQLTADLAPADRAENQDAVPYYLKLCLYDVDDVDED